MNWFLGITAVLFTILFLIWTKKDLPNLLFKIGLFVMMMWAAFLNLQALGYVVKL